MTAAPNTAPTLLDGYPVLLNVHQVAEILGRSEDRTREWLRTGAIHAVQIGTSWRVARTTLEHYLTGEAAE